MNATVIWAGPLAVCCRVNLVDRTGRKAQGEVRAEAHHLLGQGSRLRPTGWRSG